MCSTGSRPRRTDGGVTTTTIVNLLLSLLLLLPVTGYPCVVVADAFLSFILHCLLLCPSSTCTHSAAVVVSRAQQ